MPETGTPAAPACPSCRTLTAALAEARRVLYAAVDPENGARTAQEVRDLIVGELAAGSVPGDT